jgi:hypothetical protein
MSQGMISPTGPITMRSAPPSRQSSRPLQRTPADAPTAESAAGPRGFVAPLPKTACAQRPPPALRSGSVQPGPWEALNVALSRPLMG